MCVRGHECECNLCVYMSLAEVEDDILSQKPPPLLFEIGCLTQASLNRPSWLASVL